MSATQRTSWKQATAVQSESSHTYSAYFPADWCIGTVPHGGFVTSVFQNVAKKHFETTLKKCNQPHTIALGLNFLRRTEIGKALFTVKDIKLGRQTSVIHITLTQNIDNHLREEVLGYITQSNLETEEGRTFETKWALEPAVPSVDLKRLKQGDDANWFEIPGLAHQEFRKASQHVGFAFPRQGQQTLGSIDQWMHFKTCNAGERFTNESLGYVSDMWPQIIESMVVTDLYMPGQLTPENVKKVVGFWYPTVLLNLDVKKALPPDGVEWLFVRVRAKQVKNGRYDLEVIIMDELGELVALSNHVCLVLDASRNTAKRTRGEAKESKI